MIENNSIQRNNTVESVLEKIRQNKLTMRPRVYFLLRMAALISVAFAILCPRDAKSD